MEFIVHLFRNITLYKANYNTNTFDREALASASLNTRYICDLSLDIRKCTVEPKLFRGMCELLELAIESEYHR